MEAKSDSMERPLKRPRSDVDVETVKADDEQNEEVDMLQLLDGDDGFVDAVSKREEEARKRRERRRQRLAAAAMEQEEAEETKLKVEDNNPADAKSKQQDSSMLTTTNEAEKQNDTGGDDNDEDEFDMFSSSVSPIAKDRTSNTANDNASSSATAVRRGNEPSDFDDAEGYYKAQIGETIEIQSMGNGEDGNNNAATMADVPKLKRGTRIGFKVAGLVGKGVFSTVLKCTTVSNTSSIELPPTTAIKCVRANEQMAKAAVQEIKFLQQLKGSRGVVPLLLPLQNNNSMLLEHQGHVLLVFPYMEFNLRDVLIKFGKGVGLSLQAVRSFFGQLLAAGTHLKKFGIIHADLKPDNILVSGDFATVQLADFGSAFEATAPENQPTPYLVSRFYRAPEIILGLVPTIAIDLWSLAVTVAEIFLGDVLFRGKSNNEMLFLFMQHLGAFPNRVIRQHTVQCQKMPANVIPRQFQLEGTNFVFAQQTVDPISGEAVHKRLNLVHRSHQNNNTSNGNNKDKFPLATPLHPKIMKARSASDSRSSVAHFSDLLQQCLALDPSRRIALKDALQHPFFQTDEKAPTSAS